MKKMILSFGLLITIIINLYSQERDSTIQDLFRKTNILNIATEYYDNGWIKFKKDLNIKPETIFNKYKKYFGLGKDDDMILENVTLDDNGMAHYRFQQTYKGVKLEGMKYLIHSKNGVVISANGKLVSGLNLNISSPLTKSLVFKVALKDVNLISHKLFQDSASQSPRSTGELLIIKRTESEDFRSSNFIVVTNVKIYDGIEQDSIDIRVEQGSQKIHSIKSNKRQIELPGEAPTHPGTCVTLYNGTQSFKTYFYNAGWPCTNFYYLFYANADIRELYGVINGINELPCSRPDIRGYSGDIDPPFRRY